MRECKCIRLKTICCHFAKSKRCLKSDSFTFCISNWWCHCFSDHKYVIECDIYVIVRFKLLKMTVWCRPISKIYTFKKRHNILNFSCFLVVCIVLCFVHQITFPLFLQCTYYIIHHTMVVLRFGVGLHLAFILPQKQCKQHVGVSKMCYCHF